MKFTIFAFGFVLASMAFGQDCCKDKKVEAKQDSCATKSADACSTKASAEDEFMKEAQRMMLEAEGKKACCKSTAAKPIAKGDKGCCNETGQAAKFKVFVAGAGYKFFGCEGSATKGRKELLAKGAKVGNIQKVTAKTSTI